MLRIPCPHCGPRDETEFSYGGDATVAQPNDPAGMSDAEWTDFLYLRDNPKGAHRERWYHAHGCRQWIVIARDTASNRITAPDAEAAS